MEKIKEELTTIFDNAKSFYNKAYIIKYYNDNGIIQYYELYSYNTLVLTLKEGRYILNNNIDESLLLSQTTLRHIKEFLKQKRYCLFDSIKINTKKDIIKYNDYKEEF